MERLNIVYIDDDPDAIISDILLSYKNSRNDCLINYLEIQFSADFTYDKLLQDDRIVGANLVIIDSHLFTNDGVENQKFTGEEFLIILRNKYPYIESILISQDESVLRRMISKYKGTQSNPNDLEEYKTRLTNEIDILIDSVLDLRNVSENIQRKEIVNKITREKIENSISGTNYYDDLTKDDIDRFIVALKKIEG